MLATQDQIKSRIEELKVSYLGYSRQLKNLELDPQRRERLTADIASLEDEMSTLDKIAQLGRVEPDRERVEAICLERWTELRERAPREGLSASGEARALAWALGEDALVARVKSMVEGKDRPDPDVTSRQLPALLRRQLQGGPSADARASAAYELGMLGIVEAIPSLVGALKDEPIVAELALRALASFDDEQLTEADTPPDVMERIRAARTGPAHPG